VRRYRPGITLALIGDAFVAHEGCTMESALAAIASGDPTPLDVLSGKFAIIIYSRQGPRVIQDPIGSQTVFYSTHDHVAGSHAALVAAAVGAKRARAVRAFIAMDEYKKLNTRYLPGDLTVFDRVVLLTPNNALDIETRRAER
jgi:asparagine synthetase B (glutamine-hydrolysing)